MLLLLCLSRLIRLTCAEKNCGTKQEDPHQTPTIAAFWGHSGPVQKQQQSTVVQVYTG